MKDFFRSLFASLVALALFSGGCLAVLIGFAALMGTSKTVVAPRTVLVMNLATNFPDSVQDANPGTLVQKAMQGGENEGLPVHGVILALSIPTFGILAVSENLKGACPSVGGQTVAAWLPPPVMDGIRELTRPESHHEVTVMAELPDLGWREIHCFRGDDVIFVEFEVDCPESPEQQTSILALKSARVLGQFQSAPSLTELGNALVWAVRDTTGFERVLLYQFDDEGHGDVIAESLDETWEQSLMGLHFPASDIPSQARRLYLHVTARWVPVRDCDPVAIVPTFNHFTGKPFDIGYSHYRSVSPIHNLYQRNLGVDGAMTISILKDGALWGLVVGHHRQSHRVSFAVRKHVESLVSAFSLRLMSLSLQGEAEALVEHSSRHAQFLSKLAGADDFVDAMSEPPLVATDMFANCTGAAVVYLNERREIATRLIGRTPPPEDVLRLMEWLRAYSAGSVVFTDCISSIFPAFSRHAKDASGVLATFIGDNRDQALLWFRPEVIREINWGGRPEKTMDITGTTYLPRRSFERWVEQKHGHSARWLAWEIQVAGALATAMTKVILRQNRRIKTLNGEVERFLWVTSHHLRETPRRILIGCQQMRRHLGDHLDRSGEVILEQMRDTAEGMDLRLKGLLAYSEFGHAQIAPRPLQLADALTPVLAHMDEEIRSVGAVVRVLSNLPEVLSDQRGIQFVFQSLIDNAMEFRSPDREVEVNIWAERCEDVWTISIGDNGIGIEPEYHERVFNLFETLRPAEQSRGIGLGLSLCRRIIEQLGGRISLTSIPNRGTTVQFALPAAAKAEHQAEPERDLRGVDTLALLRHTTRDLHAEIERHPLMLPLSEGRVTPQQYRNALAVIYGFYRPSEELLYAKFPHLAETMGIRPKLPSLVHDLVALGFSDMEVAALPLCPAIPAVESWGEGLGMVYVLEGATLGGQVVMRRISHCLGVLSGVRAGGIVGHGSAPSWG